MKPDLDASKEIPDRLAPSRRQRWLASYASLYTAPQLYGAANVLRRHLGVSDDFIVPLTIPHGVDFGQVSGPLEVNGIEPIYWAYNQHLAEEAREIKPVVEIPHPFLLAARGQAVPLSSGPLIVGPPPGPQNDSRLLRSLRRAGITGGTMLVKPRGPSASSCDFWHGHGFATTSLGTLSTTTYGSMVDLLGRFSPVIGPTMSSVLTFSAALGAEVVILRDYVCRTYEVPDVERILPQTNPRARDYVSVFTGRDQLLKLQRARQILGGDLDDDPGRILEQLQSAVATLQSPVHFPARYPRPVRALLLQAARRLKRPGLILEPLSSRIRRLGRPTVSIMTLNEIKYWLEGPSDENVRFETAEYVAGRTIPGLAVDQYD